MIAGPTTDHHANDEVRQAARLIRDLASFAATKPRSKAKGQPPLTQLLRDFADRLSRSTRR